MEREVERDPEQVLARIRQHFANVKVKRHDSSLARSILEVVCTYQDKQISVTEVISPAGRKYSYYLRRGNAVLIGLDNAKDRHAQRLKYGKDFTQHIQERVPHRHTKGKQELELTDEKTFDDFVKIVLEFVE